MRYIEKLHYGACANDANDASARKHALELAQLLQGTALESETRAKAAPIKSQHNRTQEKKLVPTVE